MNKNTRTITLAAVFTALTVVFLYIANIIPASRFGLVAVSSLFAVAAVIETGIISAIFVFVGSSILGALLVPDKTDILLYVFFFGYYPVIKSLAERIRPVILKWAVKLAVFEISFTVIWFLFNSLIFGGKYLEVNVILVYLAGSISFVIFDIGLTKLIGFYMNRISKFIRKTR